MPYTNNTKNNQKTIFTNTYYGNFYDQDTYNCNDRSLNSNICYTQNNNTNESKKNNNLFINNNNTNINSYTLSFTKKEENENTNNFNDNDTMENNNDILNQGFCSSSNGYNGYNLPELENKKENIAKNIVYLEALCKEKHQIHINSLCESLKTQMATFQQYQRKELQINTYIDSIQNLLKNQINQINDMSNQLDKLKEMVNQQAKVSKMIDEVKNVGCSEGVGLRKGRFRISFLLECGGGGEGIADQGLLLSFLELFAVVPTEQQQDDSNQGEPDDAASFFVHSLLLLLVLAVEFLDFFFELGEFLAGDIDLLVQFFQQRFCVLRLGEEAHVVFPGGDFLLFLHELLDQPVTLAADGPFGFAAVTVSAVAVIAEFFVERFAEGVLDPRLFFEGDETDGVPAVLECPEDFAGLVAVARFVVADFFNQLAFLFQILGLFGILAAGMFVAVVEEFVAGGAEAFPHLLGFLARNGTDLFPLPLKLDEIFGGLLPVGAVFQGLGFFADLDLAGQVVLHLVLEAGVVVAFAGEELVAGGAEAVIYFLVVLLGGIADLFPFLLDVLDLLGHVVPAGRVGDLGFRNFLHAFAKGGLGFEVLPLAAFLALEISLVFLVDDGSGGAEALPDRFAVFLADRTDLLPLLMQFPKRSRRFRWRKRVFIP